MPVSIGVALTNDVLKNILNLIPVFRAASLNCSKVIIKSPFSNYLPFPAGLGLDKLKSRRKLFSRNAEGSVFVCLSPVSAIITKAEQKRIINSVKLLPTLTIVSEQQALIFCEQNSRKRTIFFFFRHFRICPALHNHMPKISMSGFFILVHDTFSPFKFCALRGL